MQIILNGELKHVEAGFTVGDLVRTLAADPRGVAIERNLEIVPKKLHDTTELCDGDALEIVQFVGGG